MNLIQIIVLAVVQGLTEFLPVSSSGHLVLVPSVFGWTDQGLVFDIAVHFGSLAAVCVFFRHDIAGLVRGALALVSGSAGTPESRMAVNIAVGTIPAAIAGLLFAGWIAANLRRPEVVVATLIGYGVLLALADLLGGRTRVIPDVTVRDSIIIGLAQALSLVPGTSRSGVTITAGMALGLRRRDAARFSFLLSAPVILLATIYEVVMLFTSETAVPWENLGLAALISGIVAYLSIDFFMRFVSQIGLVPFAIYRVLLAAVIIYVVI